jgi:queuine tRNA-ribosyltransferase
MSRYSNFSFTYKRTSKKHAGRLGILNTPHGSLQTPAFIFCATKAAIKAATIEQVKACKTQIILSNTYHLMLQPGSKLIQKMGGLHKFCGWQGPMLTDSGGFQIFSLGNGSVADEIKGTGRRTDRKSTVKISEEGALFKSYIDGKQHLLTPEKSIEIQRELGPDLVVVFDECTPFHVDKSYTASSMRMSHRWALRSLAEFDRGNDGKQALYGIIQGGVYEDLRKESVDFINDQDFFGIAVGGSLGSSKEQMYEVVQMVLPRLAVARPVHLLGIGGVRDIFSGVRQGIDTFDCVHPTRIARHGWALVKGGEKERINLMNAQFKDDPDPIEAGCSCEACRTYSKAYIHHLLKAKEILALQLITLHNITYMNRLMEGIRQSLESDSLDEEEKKWLSGLSDN